MVNLPGPNDLAAFIATLPPTADFQTVDAISAATPITVVEAGAATPAPTLADLQAAAVDVEPVPITSSPDATDTPNATDQAAAAGDLAGVVAGLRDEIAANDAGVQQQVTDALVVAEQQILTQLASAVEVTIVITP
jgi:hypothetical protein